MRTWVCGVEDAMRTAILTLGLVTLTAAGCGPDHQSMSTAPSGFGVSVGTTSPESGSAAGLSSPVDVAFHIADAAGAGGTVESGSVALRDAQGGVLVHETLAGGAVIPRGGVGRLVVKLEWPAAAGAGKRLDWSIDVRSGRGTLDVLSGTVVY
jgi:hypothetical protein